MENRSYDGIRARTEALLAEVSRLASRSPQKEVRVMAVTKNRTVEEMEAAASAGISLFGENRVQELLSKQDFFLKPGREVHFIGRLQSNKAQNVVGLCRIIESVDSLKLARRISNLAEKQGVVQSVFVQVNAGYDENKQGLLPEELEEALLQMAAMPALAIRGLMTIPPLGDMQIAEKTFSRLYELFIDIGMKKIHNVGMEVLSMGMSNDYRVAIAAGSNLIRVGSLLFDPQ